MKLHFLEIKGFGPFAKQTKIDFQPFHAAPILLIHGRTGAGKTSVLDAVTYALYGRASGMEGRTPDTLRSHMIQDTEETSVKLTFQLREGQYRASRSPEYMRRKMRGEGWMQVSPTALLEQWENDRWVPIATRVNEVNRKVESLLGFSYEQFTQVLILPQGKFRQMLIADSIQRRDIFRQLFRTGDLEAMQQRMREDTSKMKKEIEERQIRIQELFNQLQEGDETPVIGLEQARLLLDGMENEKQALEIELVRERETLKGIRKQRDQAMRLKQIEERLAAWLAKTQELAAKEDEMKVLMRKRDLGEQAQEIQGDKEALDRAKHQEVAGRTRLESIVERLSALQTSIENLQDEEDLQEEIHALREQIRLQDARKRLNDKAAWIEQMQTRMTDQLKESRNEQSVLVARKKILEDQIKHVQEMMKQEIAYALAKDLDENVPCPVCGSIHHPKLAEAISTDPEEETRLAVAKTKLDEKIAASLDQIRGFEEEHAKLEGEKRGVDEQLKGLPKAHEMPQSAMESRIQDCRQAIESARSIREQWTSLKGQRGLAEEQWENQKKIVQDCEQAWTKVLKKSGFESESAFCEAFCGYGALQEMNRTLQQHQLDTAEAKRQVTELKLQIEQQAEEGGLDLAELERRMEEWMETIDDLTQKIAAMANRTGNFKRNVDRLEVEIRRKELVEKKFGRLAWMADVASGRNSQGMDFEQYVLRRYLAEVLRVANVRLSLLTDGRYELAMQDERRDRRKRFGLEMDVFDFYTGDKRPVGSLSGGESFKASLALALALSDVVRSFAGGIELETLFIDEGFGTLDPASLDSAVEVLVELKQQNRLVGIISHVPELKERIDNRIEVVKNRGKEGSRILIHLPGGGTHETMSISNQ